MPDELAPTQAQAELDALYAKWDKATPEEAERAMELHRITLGNRGRAVVARFGGESPPPASAPAPVSPDAAPAPPMTEAPLTTPEVVMDLAAELGIEDKASMTTLIREASQLQGTYTKEDRLHGFNPVERDQLDKAFQTGFRRLPLSMQLHLERHGHGFAPKVFSQLVNLGMQLQDLDEEIAMEAEKNPASSRLRELVLRRHGQQRTIVF